jgi:hypothetical protein
MLDFQCDDASDIGKTELAEVLCRRYPYGGDTEAAQR